MTPNQGCGMFFSFFQKSSWAQERSERASAPLEAAGKSDKECPEAGSVAFFLKTESKLICLRLCSKNLNDYLYINM